MNRAQERVRRYFDGLGFSLATLDSGPKRSLIAIICGLVTGMLMVVFRLVIEGLQALFLPGHAPENYEGLSAWACLLLPVAGALVIAWIVRKLRPETRQTGVVHVMERLSYHRAQLPLRNAVWQFFGAILAIVSGQSVGREGPSIHLGAACSGLISEYLKLPRSSQRVLVSCGVAAAIAASFNTPLAGVVLSMEVIMAEYTVSSFVPVILAAVSATAVMQLFFGAAPAFHVPAVHLQSLRELPSILAVGLVIGVIAVAFIRLIRFLSRATDGVALMPRLTLAGVVTGLIAIGVPEVMGVGYDTVDQMFSGSVALEFLCLLVLAKLVATAGAIGFGIPAGVIGPTLIIGAAAGMAVGMFSQHIWFETASSPDFYAVIGMGSMMAATLQAPLAALTAIVELTANPHIIMPGMLAIVTAVMISRDGFRCPSVFQMLLEVRGLTHEAHPLTRYLQSIPVNRLMEPAAHIRYSEIGGNDIGERIGDNAWVILEGPKGEALVLTREEFGAVLSDAHRGTGAPAEPLPLPAKTASERIMLQADLLEASELVAQSDADFLCVVRASTQGGDYCGIVRRAAIEAYYRDQTGRDHAERNPSASGGPDPSESSQDVR
ncbi:MAG: chloride channel protein [Gammaproteobacteria bacterium]|nr:chloride channel protein [Gammaproteobacteria bacterium]